MVKLKVKSSHVPYLSKQLTSVCVNGNDIEQIEDTLTHITKSNVDLLDAKCDLFSSLNEKKNILEIGSGIGRISAYISKVLDGDRKFYLADGYGEYRKGVYDWNKHDFYNNLDETKSFFEFNKISNYDTIDVSKSSSQLIEYCISNSIKFDAVISYFCLSFHQDFRTYSSVLRKVCNKDAIAFITCRDEMLASEIKLYEETFQRVECHNLSMHRFPITGKTMVFSFVKGIGIREDQ